MATYYSVFTVTPTWHTLSLWSALCCLLVSSAVSVANRLAKLLLQTITKELTLQCATRRGFCEVFSLNAGVWVYIYQLVQFRDESVMLDTSMMMDPCWCTLPTKKFPLLACIPYQERIRGRSVQLPYNRVYYRSLKSAAVRCCYSELGPFFALCSSLLPAFTSIHASSYSFPTKKVSVKPEPRSPSYAACKNLPYKEGFCSARAGL